MKCTQCGCEEFVHSKLLSIDPETGNSEIISTLTYLSYKEPIFPFNPADPKYKENRSNARVDAYVCKKCGHIEFFVDPVKAVEESAAIYAKKAEEQKKKQIKLDEIEKEINAIKEEMAIQENIARSEMSVVKDVKVAKAKIIELNKKLENLKRDKLSISRR